MANYLLTLLSVLALCAFIKCFFDENCTFAPLSVISALMLWFTLFGYADRLFIGGVIWLCVSGAALAAVAYKVIKEKAAAKEKIAAVFSPDIIIFASLCIVFAFLLESQNAMFIRWDEFSFWGSAAKVTVLTDRLYTYGAFSLTNRLAYPCALPVLCYAFEFLGGEFCEWAAYAAYNTLIFAAVAAVSGAALAKRGGKKGFAESVAVITAFVCVIAVFVFESQNSVFANIYAFRSVMSEMPLGALFGGTLCIYFSKEEKDIKCFIPLILALSALSLIKDVGYVLAFIAIFIIAADMFFCGVKRVKPLKCFNRFCGFGAAVTVSVIMLFAATAAFFSWNLHVAAVTGQSRTEADGSAQLSMVGVLVNGFKELIGIGRTERYAQTFKNMIWAFFKTPVSLCFSGAVITAAVIVILLAAYFSANEKYCKRAAVCLAVTGLCGLCGMMLFQLFAYVYVFDDQSGTALIEYGRYMSAYYLGFFMAAVGVFARAVSNGEKRRCGAFAAGIAVLALCALPFMRPENTVINMSATVSENRVLLNRRAEGLKTLTETDRVYVISQGDNGEKFFNYAFLAMPAYVQEPICSLMVAPDDEQAALLPGAQGVSTKEFCEYLIKNNCGYVLLDDIDDYMFNDFAELFDDKLSSFFNNDVRLYRVAKNGDTVTLVPCMGENEK